MQVDLKDVYELKRHSFLSRLITFFISPLCSHSNAMIIKYTIKRSTNPAHKGTTKEYQMIRLAPHKHFYECSHCGQYMGEVKIYGNTLSV